MIAHEVVALAHEARMRTRLERDNHVSAIGATARDPESLSVGRAGLKLHVNLDALLLDAPEALVDHGHAHGDALRRPSVQLLESDHHRHLLVA